MLAELAELLQKEERRLHRELSIKIRSARQDLDGWVDGARARITAQLGRRRRALDQLRAQLETRHPRAQLVAARSELQKLHGHLDTLVRRRVDRAGREFSSLAVKLESFSPLRVLDRGYSIATSQDKVITSADQVAAGDELQVRLARGTLDCRVEASHPASEASEASDRGPEDSK